MLLKLLPTNFVMPGFQPVMLQLQPNCSTIELHPALQYTVCTNAAYKSLCFPAPQYCIALAAMHRGKVWVFSSTVASALELSRKCSISSYCEPFFPNKFTIWQVSCFATHYNFCNFRENFFGSTLAAISQLNAHGFKFLGNLAGGDSPSSIRDRIRARSPQF